jgi:hypothetical protein
MLKLNKYRVLPRMAAFGLGMALAFATTIAHAETRTFKCDFASRYSQSEAAAALSYARMTVGSGEASSLYGAYVSLRNECKSNPTAKRVVHLSSAIVALIEN